MTEETGTGLAGTILRERYRVGEVLGHGGMGSVYRGTDLVLNREVALKIFRDDVTDPEELARQQAEARMLAQLNHHGLVTLFDVGTMLRGQREVPFLVMELVTGTDLRRHLAAGPLAGEEGARLGAELAEALHYIHDRGVVHRDVKPANILLTRYAAGAPLRPKLADFGIARMLDGARLTATNMVPGTAAYLSPEQARGDVVGPPADIYSLGLVLLEALTGTVAFPGPPMEAAVARLTRTPDTPDALGQQWKSLLTRMTARDPQDRPDAANVARILSNPDGWNLPVEQAQEAPTTLAAPHPATRILAGGEAAIPRSSGQAPPQDARLPSLPDSQATNATAWHPAPHMPAHAPASAQPGPATGPARPPLRELPGFIRTRRFRGLAAAAVVLLVLAGVLLASLLRTPTSPAETPVVETPGPVIPGQLGEHFKELEGSVTP